MRCPLLNRPFGNVNFHFETPGECLEQCERLWDKALKNNNLAGDYDPYTHYPLAESESDNECKHDSSIVFSHESLIAINQKLREYVVVDMCERCDEEMGEQGYEFICPNV